MKTIQISEIIKKVKEGTVDEENLKKMLESLYWTGHFDGMRECENQGEELYNP